MPKIDLSAVPLLEGSGYPPPFDAPCSARVRGVWAMRVGFEIWRESDASSA